MNDCTALVSGKHTDRGSSSNERVMIGLTTAGM